MRYAKWPKTVKPTSYINHGIRKRPSDNMKKGKLRGTKIGVDLSEIKGRKYLVSVDYFSNFLEVYYLSTTTTKQVITRLKEHFARYGIPPTDGN